MKLLLSIGLIVGLTIIACYFVRKLIENFFNLMFLLEEKKHPGTLPRHESIVFNSETQKLEDDSSVILPF